MCVRVCVRVCVCVCVSVFERDGGGKKREREKRDGEKWREREGER